MSRIFQVIGIITVVLIGFFTVAFLWLIPQGIKVDQESKAYVDSVVPKIIQTWDNPVLLEYASPELRKIIDESPEKNKKNVRFVHTQSWITKDI